MFFGGNGVNCGWVGIVGVSVCGTGRRGVRFGLFLGGSVWEQR